MLLGWLVVDYVKKGKGVGEFLFMNVLYCSLFVVVEIVVFVVLVDVKDVLVEVFYKYFGFI